MSFLDKAKAALTDAVDKHGGKIADGIDKAADAVDKKTKGKHHDKIEGATSKARDGPRQARRQERQRPRPERPWPAR